MFKLIIEKSRDNNGNFQIENGNHRLQIANELGIKEIPIKFVESWDNIGIQSDTSESEVRVKVGDVYDSSNKISNRNNNVNEGDRNFERSSRSNSDQFENRGTTKRNAKLFAESQNINQQTSDIKTQRNNKQIKNSNKSFLFEIYIGICYTI